MNQVKKAIEKLKLQKAPLITRFAPSPTGYLHMGHVGHILYLWIIAKATESQIILRMEDHDQSRCKKVYEESIFDDLGWLGLDWSNHSFQKSTESTPFRQSDCLDLYAFQMTQLLEQGLVYPCSCSRKQVLERMAKSRIEPINGELVYDGHCIQHPPTSSDVGYRLKIDKRKINFNDLSLGPMIHTPSIQKGDILIKDRNKNFTYQWTVVLDDLRQQINLIIRGRDLTNTTGLQIQIRQILGEEAIPHYFHHPIMKNDTGKKLSKRSLDRAISDLRHNKVPAESIIGEAAYKLGLIETDTPISISELTALIMED